VKTVIMFWLFLILGYFATSIISKIAYTIVDIPLGVPLAKLGIIGAAVQISFIILPFIIAPILTGWVYYRKFRRLPAKRETLNLTIAIACSMVALYHYRLDRNWCMVCPNSGQYRCNIVSSRGTANYYDYFVSGVFPYDYRCARAT